MIHRLRTRPLASLAAMLLIAATLVASGESLRHVGDDDPACDGVVIVHDASAHALRSAPARPGSSEPEHCAICHWARSLRPVVEAVVRGGADLAASLDSIDEADPLLPLALALHLPARAPPA